MGLESVRLITFDCYGTLIDWETGMLAAMRPLFSEKVPDLNDAKLLEFYGEAEGEIEEGPYLPYRQVLAKAVSTVGDRLGVKISGLEAEVFAQSIMDWKPFPDTVASLRELARNYRLGIISNIDDELFAATQLKLLVPFDLVVTAQQVRSYKPSFKNFEEMLRRSGIPKEQVLHAAQSLYHDIAPANALGLQNVWVNRRSTQPGPGATRASGARPTHQVRSLAELAALMESHAKRQAAT